MTTETATPNQADASTAFLRAARAGQIDKILALLKQDVDINVSNANGLNAIHLASKDGHAIVVSELLSRGASIDAATKKGNTALHIASLAGQEHVVKLLVQHGAQVNIQSQNGFTPLYMAAQENHDGVVKFLLANGANQSLATEDGFTPLAVAMQQGHERVVAVLLEADTRGRVRLPALHIAAKKDDVKAATLLLQNDHNPDVTSKSGFTPLHIAAHYGNEAVATLLLNKGADVNCPAKHSICPLHVAAKWGKESMVALLCERGASVEARTRDGLTPLHCAARSGHERVVEALIQRGAPITSKSKNGLAPLHMAAQGDHAEAARVLLAARAPVDDVTVDYLTALHVAAHCGHARAAKLLLDRSADPNARALNGFTPLHIACKKNRIKVVELLLKYGASISATTESGLTPLHVASFMGCMNIVIYLLQHEASPDVPTVRGETPLHLAARANQTDIIRILVRNGAAVEARAREQQTPLHIAARLGNADIVVLLLQHGARVDSATNDNYNALHIAAKQHNHDVAAALVDHGAPLTATTKKGFTPLHLAAKYGNLKVANLLLAHGAPPDLAGKNGVTPLHVAAQYDQQAVALTLLEKGANAKAAAKNGHTPLHIAARKNQMETAATLLEYGALPNAESKAGFTPLHLAAQQGHAEMCSLLAEHGADVNQQARNGLAPMHLAAQEDRVPVASLLVKNSAKVDVCTKGGYTPLHVASHFGQTNMVRYLLENDAMVRAKTCHGYTALHHAAQQGHINIVNLLLERKAEANDCTNNGQTPLDIAQKLGYVTVMETLKAVSEPSVVGTAKDEKYKVVAPETMHETFMSDSEEEGGEDTMLTDQPYRYLTADDMKSLGDDSLPIDVTRDERAESAIGQRNIMEISQGSVNGLPYPADEVMVKSASRIYNSEAVAEGYCYNVEHSQPSFLVSFLVDARGGAMRGCRGGGVRVIVPPTSAQQPTRITCRYLKPSRINHMPPLMEGEALASRVLEMGPVSAKFLGPVILEVPHFAALRGKEREIVILRSDNGTNWREHTLEATDEVIQDILNETLEIEESTDEPTNGSFNRVTRILTHDFPQYFAVISRIRQEVHAIGPEGGIVSSSVVPQVQAVFPQGALTKKIKVGLQAQIISTELTAKLLGRGVAVSPVVTVEPRRRKFHKAITLSVPAPRPHSLGMTNQYSASAPTLRLLCSISGVFRKRSLEGGTNRAHWEDVTDNTPLTFVNDCVSFTTTVSARYWLIDCRNVGDATKMATELYREAIHVPFMARFVVYGRRMDPQQAQLRMFCITDDREHKTLERMERFTQVAKSRDVEVHEGKPCYLEFAGNLVPIAKSGEQLAVPFRAFRENRLAFPVMVKSLHADPVARCQFMREPRVPKGEPSPTPVCVLNIVVPEEKTDVDVEAEVIPVTRSQLHDEQELVRRQRLSDPRLEEMCSLLGRDWVALAYELGVGSSAVNQIQAQRLSSAEQAQLMLRLWRSQGGSKAQDNLLELALCRIGRDDIIMPLSNVEAERRIQRNIYQERQASEELHSFKDEDTNKAAEYDEDQMEQARMASEIHEAEEAKYSPEEKSYVAEVSERDLTPSPSEDSEEDDEDVKRSVAERKMQITRKLSSSKVPASKQKREIREEISEIKKQIKPDVKKFHEIKSSVTTTTTTTTTQISPEMEKLKSKVSVEKMEDIEKPISTETVTEIKTIESVIKKPEIESSPKAPLKHLQKHMRNESMHRFSSGDFSDIKIIPKQKVIASLIVTEKIDVSQKLIESESLIKEAISQKEIATSKVEEKFDDYLEQSDGDKSPEVIMDDERDAAEAPLKEKISSFESKMQKEQNGDLVKSSSKVKLTKEALRKHTEDFEQDVEYTKEFVREQAKQVEQEVFEQDRQKSEVEVHKEDDAISRIKSVKETIQKFDSQVQETNNYVQAEKPTVKTFGKSMRTDSTIVQVSSEEDIEFLKKSTDSETETESQTTVRIEKGVATKAKEVKAKLIDGNGEIEEEVLDRHSLDEAPLREDDILKKQLDQQTSVASSQSEYSKTQTRTDSFGSDAQDSIGKRISRDSPGLISHDSPVLVSHSTVDKTDSLVDLQQSTERDISFVSQTESKVYSKQARSDSLDEASQFSDMDEVQPLSSTSPAHRPTDLRTQTAQFLEQELEYNTRVIETTTASIKPPEKPSSKETSPVISAKARQFIETVPEDDSVQECFFSKRIYSDSLEDSDHTDSRRHSEADSLKSDQSDLRMKISSSEFDERAEYEDPIDSGSAFGDEKFEESILAASRQDSAEMPGDRVDSDSSDTVFKKMTPKRHSRSDSVSITKFSVSDFQEAGKPRQEFQMFVTEAEDVTDRSSDLSEKISSESSREIEISERKSSDGISDRISSEDGVTEKKTSSEDASKESDKDKDDKVEKQVAVEVTPLVSVKETIKELEKTEMKIQGLKEELMDKGSPVDMTKRQSVTSGSSIGEIFQDEKRLSDAHSLTESRDYTFEESEDSFGAHLVGTARDKPEDFKQEVKVVAKAILEPILAQAKEAAQPTIIHKTEEERQIDERQPAPTAPSKIMQWDSLDDVEAFPEDHVSDHVHKLPEIEEAGQPTSIESEKSPEPTSPKHEEPTITTMVTIEKHVQKTSKTTEKQESVRSEATISTSISLDTPEKLSAKELIKTTTAPTIKTDLEKITSESKAEVKTVEEIVSKEITTNLDEAKVVEKAAKEETIKVEKDSSLAEPIKTDIVKDDKPKTDDQKLEEAKRETQDAKAVSEVTESFKEEISEEVSKFISSVVTESQKHIESVTVVKEIVPIKLPIIPAVEPVKEAAKYEGSRENITEQTISKITKFPESELAKKPMYSEFPEKPKLPKSLSRDSGEILITKKKSPRTYSVQSSPDDVEEQIYTDSESDMDKAKVLEIIEPSSDIGHDVIPAASFDARKLRTDSLDDADDLFPEKEAEYITVDHDVFMQLKREASPDVSSLYIQEKEETPPTRITPTIGIIRADTEPLDDSSKEDDYKLDQKLSEETSKSTSFTSVIAAVEDMSKTIEDKVVDTPVETKTITKTVLKSGDDKSVTQKVITIDRTASPNDQFYKFDLESKMKDLLQQIDDKVSEEIDKTDSKSIDAIHETKEPSKMNEETKIIKDEIEPQIMSFEDQMTTRKIAITTKIDELTKKVKVDKVTEEVGAPSKIGEQAIVIKDQSESQIKHLEDQKADKVSEKLIEPSKIEELTKTVKDEIVSQIKSLEDQELDKITAKVIEEREKREADIEDKTDLLKTKLESFEQSGETFTKTVKETVLKTVGDTFVTEQKTVVESTLLSDLPGLQKEAKTPDETEKGKQELKPKEAGKEKLGVEKPDKSDLEAKNLIEMNDDEKPKGIESKQIEIKEQHLKKEPEPDDTDSRDEVEEKEDGHYQKPSPTLIKKFDKLANKLAVDEKKLETVVMESKTVIDEIVAKAISEETPKDDSIKSPKEEKERDKLESKTDDEKAKEKAADVSKETAKPLEHIPDEDRSPDLDDTDKIVSEMKEMNRMDRRCSDLIEGMSSHSQGGALVRIDTSHITRDLSLRFSKTPPPSPVDLNAREKAKAGEISADKLVGLQPKGPDTYLDASNARLSPKEARASSAGDSVISETEAHQSELLTGVSNVLHAAATPKSPIRHMADNLSFVNVDQPTITTGAKELIDRTIETSINVIDQIKMEQHAAKMEQMEKDKQTAAKTDVEEKTAMETKEDVVELKKMNTAELSDLKFEHLGSEFLVPTLRTELAQYDTVVTHTETETRKISGQEYFTETKHISSSDDDSLVIKMETVHEVSGQEHEVKHKTVLRRDKDETEIETQKTEKAQEVTAKRSDVETKTTMKSSDDTDVVVVQRQFLEQGLYAGRQTKSEEKMSAIKDDVVTKTNEVTYSERDLHHEQWGKEYFTEGSELEDIKETDDDSLGPKDSFIESSLQIVEKDESISTEEISEKGVIVSSKTNYTVEESVVVSKEHDDLSDRSHGSAPSESMGPRESEKSEVSPKSRSKSFKKDNEVYEVDFITEIKVSSASPVSKILSRGGSQDTQSESDLVPDEILEVSTTKTDSPLLKSPIRRSQEMIQEQVWEVSVEKQDSFEKVTELPEAITGFEISPEQDEDTVIIDDEKETTLHTKLPKGLTEMTIKLKTELVGGPDESQREAPSEEHDALYKDIMMKSGESVDTEYMVKSLESQEAEALQKSIDSVSAETLHPSEFSTEADSAFHTGTEQKKEEHKFIKEKSLEDICSSGYDTDLSSAEFHATKLETEHEPPPKSTQQLTDLSVLEKTIDEVKQSLEAAQGEIIGEKSDGSSAYKQSPSEFEFKLISPDKPEVIAEEPVQGEDISDPKFVKDREEKGTLSKDMSMSQDETVQTVSDEDKDTIIGKDRSSTLTDDMSGKSDSGPHSILETESDVATSDRDESSKGSPDVKLRQSKKHVKTKIITPVDRRSGSDVEGWSNSGESHYQSFEHTDSPHSRPLSSDVENLLTATADFETALTTQDVSSQSLRTSKDFYTAPSSFTSRDSMKSLDSESSSQLASIDISDASETLVPSAHELKEELMESSNYTDNFLPEQDSQRGSVVESVEVDAEFFRNVVKGSISGDEVSPEEEVGRLIESTSAESLGKMKRSHEMRFQPKDFIPEKFSLDILTESIDIEDANIEKVEKVTKPTVDTVQEKVTVTSIDYAIPPRTFEDHTVTRVTRKTETTREVADITSEIIPVGSSEYEQIIKSHSTTFKSQETSKTQPDQANAQSYPIDSKQSSSSSLKIQEPEYLSTPQTPISLPSQSSESTDNGREYILDEMYEISAGIEAPRSEKGLQSKSELSVTTDQRTFYEASGYAKDQDSPISDEFEMVDKPSEMDDFVVIEEVAREAQETDMEGKSLQIKKVKYEKKHDEEVEEYLSKTSKKQDSEYSTSGSLSEEEMLQYEAEQKRLKLAELAEVEAGKKWIQMQFEGEAGRYEYERVPLEDIKEEEMTDFDASRIGSLSSQKESIGSYGSLRNSYGSLSESEMMSRRRFMIKGEQDDISISSLQEFENLEQALIEQYQQHSSSSQDSLNGSLPRRYQLSKSAQGDDVSIASLKEFEGLESACIEALKVEIEAKQKEAQLLSQEAKSQSSSFIDSERRSHSLGSSECSPPQKSGSPSQKSGSPSQKSGSPSLRDGSPSQKQISQLQKSIADSPAIRKLIDQQISQAPEKVVTSSVTTTGPTIVTVQRQKFDDRGAFFTPTEGKIVTKPIEIAEPECVKRSSFTCATESVLQESLPGDCEEMMKILDQQELERKAAASSRTVSEGVIEVVRTTKVIQQKFVDGKKVSENVSTMESDGGVDIPGARIREFESTSDSYRGVNVGSGHSFSSEMSSSATSQQSDMDSLITMMEKPDAMESSSTSSTLTRTMIHQMSGSMEKPTDLQIGSEVVIKEISPSSGRTIVQTILSSSGKHVPDPASGSWSGQEEDLDSSGSFSRARDTDLMLGSTDSLEATSSNATRATYNYEVDTPMTGSLTSGGSHTMVSSLDTLDPVTAFCLDSLEHGDGNSYSERVDYEIHEPDSETDRMELDTRVPRAKARTVMFDSSDTLSAASQGEEGTATFFIGDTPIIRGEHSTEEGTTSGLSLSCPSGTTAPPIPAQRRSLSGLTKLPHSTDDTDTQKK